MRKVTMMRWGVGAALAVLGVAGSMAVGCTGDDTNPTTPNDSGVDTSVTPKDSGGSDTSTPDTGGHDAGDAGQKPIAKMILVHASPNLPPVRLCYLVSLTGAVVDTPALPDDPATTLDPNFGPGLYPGTGGPLPSFPIDPSTLDITAFAINSQKVKDQTSATAGGETKCVALIGQDGSGGTLHPGTDFWQLPKIPKNTFHVNNTYLLAMQGCLPGDTGGDAKCGVGYADAGASGNLNVTVSALDVTSAPDAGIGAQFAHRSSQFASAFPHGLIPAFITMVPYDAGPPADAGDGGDAAAADAAPTMVPVPIPLTSAPVNFGDVAPATAAQPTGIDLTQTPLAVFTPNGDGGLSLTMTPLPLFLIQLLTTGNAPVIGDAGTMFVAGETYTFILVGDPSSPFLLPDGGTNRGNIYAGRMLAFPNHLPVPALTQ